MQIYVHIYIYISIYYFCIYLLFFGLLIYVDICGECCGLNSWPLPRPCPGGLMNMLPVTLSPLVQWIGGLGLAWGLGGFD